MSPVMENDWNFSTRFILIARVNQTISVYSSRKLKLLQFVTTLEPLGRRSRKKGKLHKQTTFSAERLQKYFKDKKPSFMWIWPPIHHGDGYTGIANHFPTAAEYVSGGRLRLFREFCIGALCHSTNWRIKSVRSSDLMDSIKLSFCILRFNFQYGQWQCWSKSYVFLSTIRGFLKHFISSRQASLGNGRNGLIRGQQYRIRSQWFWWWR